MARKKARSAKQKANDKRLGRMAKARAVAKRTGSKPKIKRRSKVKRKVRTVRTTRPSKTRRSRGGSASDVNKSLLLDDVAKLGVSSSNKNKIINMIAKRLKI